MIKTPKVLIVSHNPLSDNQSNGKTLTSLLSIFPKESLAQLYFTMDTPDFTICNNFFRISDLDILKNFFLLNNDVGNVINESYSKNIAKEKQKLHKNFLYSFIRKLFVSKISVMTTIRDFVWRNSEYYSKKFEKWIDEFNPDIIFFQSSNCCFAFDFVYEICKRKNIKIIMQTTDDYLSYRVFGLFFNLNVYRLRKSYKRINEHTIMILPISKKMELYYNKYYKNNYYVAMNSVIPKDVIENSTSNKKTKILYAGNLGLNRWKIIYKLAKTINKFERDNAIIEVYSIEPPSKKVLNKLNEFNCCKYCGSLNSEQLLKKREESDVLLHVESFDYVNKHLTKYSISTKIPELMNSSKAILAIGPSNVASIEYLKECGAAFVIDNIKNEYFVEKINEFLSIKSFKKYIKNAHNSVVLNHDIYKVQECIRKVIVDYYDKK